MSPWSTSFSPKLKARLISDEIADLELYRSFRRHATGSLGAVLDQFIATEIRHAAFWQHRFGMEMTRPTLIGRVRNVFLGAAGRIGGPGAMALILEAVEVNGVNKYLALWKTVHDVEVRNGLRGILTDELQHEDQAVAEQVGKIVSPENVRNAFLGFNDGSVEILGAVVGFAMALSDASLVAVTGLTVSVAGSLSMAAGAFLSTHGEVEMQALDAGKREFLEHGEAGAEANIRSPWRAGFTVGIAYFIGAAVPVLPFVLGAQTAVWSIVLSGSLILAVSALLAFLSGMRIRRRLAMNIGVIVMAVLISALVGEFAESVFRG